MFGILTCCREERLSRFSQYSHTKSGLPSITKTDSSSSGLTSWPRCILAQQSPTLLENRTPCRWFVNYNNTQTTLGVHPLSGFLKFTKMPCFLHNSFTFTSNPHPTPPSTFLFSEGHDPCYEKHWSKWPVINYGLHDLWFTHSIVYMNCILHELWFTWPIVYMSYRSPKAHNPYDRNDL